MRAWFGNGNPLTKMSVKQQFLLLFVLLISPVFVLHWYGNSKAEQILTRHVTEAYRELNKENHLLIGRDLGAIDQVTRTIIQNPLVQSLGTWESETIYERVREYVHMEQLLTSYSQGGVDGEAMSFSLYIYDPDQYYSFAPDNFTSTEGVYFYNDKTVPVWMEDAVSRKGSGFLTLLDKNWPIAGKKTLAYVRAVNSTAHGGKAIGALVVTNMEHTIRESLRTVSLPFGEIYLTDSNNRILAATTPEMGSILQVDPEYEAKIKPGGTVDFMSSGYVYVVNANPSLSRQLYYLIPVKTLLRQQSELTRVIQLISIVYAAFAAIVMVYQWRSLIAPLHKLASFIRTYEPGKLVPSTPGAGRRDEVGVLIASVYDSTRRINDFVEYKYLMELKQKESQLQLLYQQINPHLLYNTLESIYWKSILEGNSESAEMIKELSKLMKIALSRGRELITLREELEHAQAYTGLQRKRYEYGFQVEWSISDEVLDRLIPKVTLQPLIENAINHGVKNMGEDGRIIVTAYARDKDMIITVEDNGYKEADMQAIDKLLNEEQSHPDLGYGIRNVHQRIRLHFGDAFGLTYRREPGVATIATIILPIGETSPVPEQ
ncbi:histidine kinase [Cohnella kolymensis]|uniref:Histidine kinase n=1 Tax=Cohnella kolymensis TaxID=1590652 RepID=A0ABR5A8Z5_9BACL|nr:histidine kinase [Cohnella kolymensis]KIL37474.1 histidine kinase [Cohnella kolymensis]